MKIQLSDHFTIKKLFLFVLPSIGMMVFTSIYGVVDGFFVSNYAGGTAFAAMNLILPLILMLSSFGFMLGAGGSALVSMFLGRKEQEKAESVFSMIVYFMIVTGIIFALIGQIVLEPVCLMLGATKEMLPYCMIYARISFISLPAYMLQNLFQNFLVTAEKPKLGLWVTVLSGMTNIIFDFILVGILSMGVAGAAMATAASEFLGGLIPLFYFARPNSGLLRLRKTTFQLRYIVRASGNGASEFLTNISASLVSMLYNLQLLKFAGENGVSANGVIMYINFIFTAIFIGYTIGIAPVVGYNYGAKNKTELRSLLHKSLYFTGVVSIGLFVIAELFAVPISKVFVGYDEALFTLSLRAFRIVSFSFLVIGFNVFVSAFFTALNNGAVSAVISFSRTFVMKIVLVLLLPVILGVDGIWLSNVCAEILALVIAILFLMKMKPQYGY